MSQPKFVEYGGTQNWPTPITFSNVTLYGFWLKGDYAKIQALCDKFFLEPSGGEVRVVPLTSAIMLSFNDISRGQFDTQRDRGYSSEREVTFWIFGLRQRRTGDGWQTEDVAAFSPYLFLDNTVALIVGREGIGYLKQAGWITLPEDNDPEAEFAADVFGCEQFGEDVKWARHRYITLGRGKKESATEVVWDSIGDAIRSIAGLVADTEEVGLSEILDIGWDELSHILKGELPQIFLRQLRDSATPETCCYQAITQSVMTVTKFKGAGLAWSYPLSFAALESTPVVDELGLHDTSWTGLGMRIEMDMHLANGTVLWSAGGS